MNDKAQCDNNLSLSKSIDMGLNSSHIRKDFNRRKTMNLPDTRAEDLQSKNKGVNEININSKSFKD